LLLAGAAGLVTAGAGSVRAADTTISLPASVTYLTQTLPDRVGNGGDLTYLFVAANGAILVYNPAGTLLATLDAGDGIGGLAVSDNGETLYASVASGAHAGSVAAINVTASITAPAQTYYPLAAGDQPASLVVQSGKVWVSYSSTANAVTTVHIGAIDLANGGKFQAAAAPGSWTSGLDLAADPGDNGVLVAVADQSPAEAATYDTKTSPATTLAARGDLGSGGTACSYPGEVAVVPGGAKFLAGCDGPSSVIGYATADIKTGVAAYFANGGGTSQAIATAVDRGSGLVAAANRTTAYVYQPDGKLTGTLTIPAGNKIDEGFGLEWTDVAGVPYLTAVYQSTTTKAYAIELAGEAPPAQHTPTLKISPASTTVNYATVVHVTATLGKTSASRALTIYAEVNGSGKQTVIAAGQVNAKGQLTVAYRAARSTTFEALFKGDAGDAAVHASTVVAVRAKITQALSGAYGSKKSGQTTYQLYHRTARLTAAITVTPAHPGACVALRVQEFTKGAWRAAAETACTKLGKASKATINLALAKDQLGIPYRVRSDFTANNKTNASNNTPWQYFLVEK
jgi:hypothetical protein